ncbi:hypothetical protein AAMO2058_001456800 [Amorphochlora amoebiformis]
MRTRFECDHNDLKTNFKPFSQTPTKTHKPQPNSNPTSEHASTPNHSPKPPSKLKHPSCRAKNKKNGEHVPGVGPMGGGEEVKGREELGKPKACEPIVWKRSFEKESKAEWKALEMEAGDMVILHPRVLHKSSANRSNLDRRAFTLHLIDQALPWDQKNWIQPKKDIGYFPCFPQCSKPISKS